MIFNNKESEKVTLEDGRTVWLSRSCAVVNTVWCIVNKQPKLLIGKRGPGCPDEVGKWNIPCGYLDWNETLKEASERETWEETGVNIKDINAIDIILNYMNSPWLITSDIRADNSGKQNVSMHHAIVFEANELPKLTNEHCEPDEISDLKWISINEVDDFTYAFNHKHRIHEFIENHLQLTLDFI